MRKKVMSTGLIAASGVSAWVSGETPNVGLGIWSAAVSSYCFLMALVVLVPESVWNKDEPEEEQK